MLDEVHAPRRTTLTHVSLNTLMMYERVLEVGLPVDLVLACILSLFFDGGEFFGVFSSQFLELGVVDAVDLFEVCEVGILVRLPLSLRVEFRS